MAGLTVATQGDVLGRYINNQVLSSVILGIIFATPIWPWLKRKTGELAQRFPAGVRPIVEGTGHLAESLILVVLLLISAAWLAAGTYNPFIYFRF